MTLRLILTRHAKSAWDDPATGDHARVLTARGRRSAPLIGAWLAANGYEPDLALVSDAARTRETWALIAKALPAPVPARILPALYLAGPELILRALQSASGTCVMLIGHNPGIADAAALLLDKPLSGADFARYPTAATLVADFDLPDWSTLRFGAGKARDFVIPRLLEASS